MGDTSNDTIVRLVDEREKLRKAWYELGNEVGWCKWALSLLGEHADLIEQLAREREADRNTNRELTRQVEQMAAEAAVLQARVDAAEKLVTKVRGIADTVRWWTQESGDPRVFNSARRIVELIDESALTAPLYSSTGMEER